MNRTKNGFCIIVAARIGYAFVLVEDNIKTVSTEVATLIFIAL